jgi:uncharacterized protein YjiK
MKYLLAQMELQQLSLPTTTFRPLSIRQMGYLAATLVTVAVLAQVFSSAHARLPAYASLFLDEYEQQGSALPLSGVTHNASGLTYNPDTQSLFAITNNPTAIIELDTSGNTLRQIELLGFQDTEGLVYLGNQRFAITEERRRSIAIIKIGSLTRTSYRADAQHLTLPFTTGKNKGFEGISYDANSDSLFVVNEKLPRALYQISGYTSQAQAISVSSPWNLEENHFGNSDYSGVHYDPTTRNLLLLSDESRRISEISQSGELLSELDLPSGFLGFPEGIPQPEGITMDTSGNLYVLSEPNLFYRFARKK